MGIRFTKTVYDPPELEDGCRLVIMRRWPRGVARARAHAWLPEDAPTLELVHYYHDTLNDIRARLEASDPERCEREVAKFWKTYSRRYLAEMKAHRPSIEFLACLERRFGIDLTLLCGCPDHRICHRSLLGALIAAVPDERLPAAAPAAMAGLARGVAALDGEVADGG